MKGFENSTYVLMYVISNIVGFFMLWSAWRKPTLARILFFLLFAWASWTNWRIINTTPNAYLEYADLTFLDIYEQFIHGWFRQHSVAVVRFIATSQALIALSMFMGGWLFKWGCIGGVIFLLAIAPFGVGSAFPCTIFMSIALYLILRKCNEPIFPIAR